MDRLGADQAEQLRKCSTDRLRIKLSNAGGDEETIAAMGRDQLLDMLATLMLASPPQSLVQGNPEEQAHTEKEPGLVPQRDKDSEISNTCSKWVIRGAVKGVGPVQMLSQVDELKEHDRWIDTVHLLTVGCWSALVDLQLWSCMTSS